MQQAFSYDERLAPGRVERVRPGIRRVLCNNPGPFTERGTNTWLVGDDDVVVIDPGPSDLAHLAAILRATAGECITHILVTHTHGDHSAGARDLSDATGAPIYGFGEHPRDGAADGSADLSFQPDYRLAHGDRLRCGVHDLLALHTPGHCSTHLCFALEPDGIVFGGDHIMAWSTTVIAAPDGDIADYLASLRLFEQRADRLCLAAHGAPVTDPGRLAAGLARFVQAREARVLDTLRGLRRASAADIAELLYGGRIGAGLTQSVVSLVTAHLRKLACDGGASERNQAWVAA